MINHMQGKSYVGNVKSYVKKMTKSYVVKIICNATKITCRKVMKSCVAKIMIRK